MALQRPPEVPLGPLTDCLARRVILSLPWLARVRAESVCRGWLACLRSAPAAAVDTAAALAECRAAGLRFSRNKAGEPETRKAETVVAEALRLRAAAAARCFRIGDDHSLLTLLVPAPIQGIEALTASDVSASALNAAFDALAGADGAHALPVRLRLQRVLLSDATGLADCDALRLFSRRVAVAATERAVAAKAAAAVGNIAVAGDLSAEAAAKALELEAAADAAFAEAADAAQLHLRLSSEFLAYVEDAGEDVVVDDARVVRCARLGRALARQQWPRVTVELFRLDESLTEDDGSAAIATLLEVCFSSMQDELDMFHLAPLASDRRFTLDLRNSGAALDIQDARRVVRAAPRHVRILFGDVVLESAADVDALPAVLVPDREHGANVRLSFDGPYEPALIVRLTSALSVAGCSESGLVLSMSALDADNGAHIFNCLRSLTTLRGLRVRLAEDSIAELLAALPPSLRWLDISGTDVTETSHLLVAALHAGRLPLLECLVLCQASLKDGETARSLADYIQQLTPPFTLCLGSAVDERSWDVFASLIKYASFASGIPSYAAVELLKITGAVPLALLDALVASIFAALREESEIVMHECQPPVFPMCHVECVVTGPSVLARLLLHLYDRAPLHMAALLSSPEHVLLIAKRVRRARSRLALADDFLFTPLLHRMLLIVAGGTGALSQAVLSAVADACIRDEPGDPEARFDGLPEEHGRYVHKCYEARFALLTMLLACASAGDTCAEDPAFAGAIRCSRELHPYWLLDSVMLLCMQARGAGSISFLSLGDDFGELTLKFSFTDAALHLVALSRVSSRVPLRGTFLDVEMQCDLNLDLKSFLKEPDPSHWLSMLIKDSPSALLFDALDVLAPPDVASALFCHLAVISMSVKPAPALGDVDHITLKLYRLLLSWASVSAPPLLVTGSTLLPQIGDACIALLPEGWTSAAVSPIPLRLAYTASLAWYLASHKGIAELANPSVADWVLQHISALLKSICQSHASTIAGNRGCESFSDVALLLRAAGDVFCSSFDPEANYQFTAELRVLASQLVTAGWVRSEGSANPLRADTSPAPLLNAARTAEAAYVGLAQLIQKLPPDYVKSLSVQLQTSVPGGAPGVLDNLGRELAQLSALHRCLVGRPQDSECADHVKCAANARAHFCVMLRKLRPALEPKLAGSLQLSAYALAALTAARSAAPAAAVTPATGAV